MVGRYFFKRTLLGRVKRSRSLLWVLLVCFVTLSFLGIGSVAAKEDKKPIIECEFEYEKDMVFSPNILFGYNYHDKKWYWNNPLNINRM